MCIHGRRYACCGERNVVSNECDDPTSFLVQPIGTHGGKVNWLNSLNDNVSPEFENACGIIINSLNSV